MNFLLVITATRSTSERHLRLLLYLFLQCETRKRMSSRKHLEIGFVERGAERCFVIIPDLRQPNRAIASEAKRG
jgi:hypothetical protein